MKLPRRRISARVASLLGVVLAFGAACSAPSGNGAVGPTPAATPPPVPTATPEATSVPVSNAPVPTPDPRQQAFGLHSPLPLAGEFAVTGNVDDRTLSVVPIGAAAVATTVHLDMEPRAIGAAPNSDTVLAADNSPTSHQLAVASLNSSSESGTIDVGSTREEVAGPPPSGSSAPLLVLSDADNTIRSVDPTSQALGASLPIGAGPHAVYVASGNAMLTPQVFVANAGDGTITVLDQKLTTVQDTLTVDGKPVGVTRTVDGRLWVADGGSGNVTMFDASSGDKLQTIQVGPNLRALASTPDGHFLTLASDSALYAVDLVSSMIGGTPSAAGGSGTNPVRQLPVPAGVLALATGAEITRAYATTGDGNLIYWDLESNSIAQTIPVGHNPVALTLGLVEPSGGVSVPQGAGTTGGGGATTGSTGGTGSAGSLGSTTAPGTTSTGSTGSTAPGTTSGGSTSSSAPSTTGSGSTSSPSSGTTGSLGSTTAPSTTGSGSTSSTSSGTTGSGTTSAVGSTTAPSSGVGSTGSAGSTNSSTTAPSSGAGSTSSTSGTGAATGTGSGSGSGASGSSSPGTVAP